MMNQFVSRRKSGEDVIAQITDSLLLLNLCRRGIGVYICKVLFVDAVGQGPMFKRRIAKQRSFDGIVGIEMLGLRTAFCVEHLKTSIIAI